MKEAVTDRCPNIRWKDLLIDGKPDLAVPRSDEPPCWCVWTQTCLGPDGQVVNLDTCNGTRSCYEAPG